jgi:lipopolysaccharide exporter
VGEFRRLVSLSLAIQALVAIPAGVGIALVAQDAVPLLLGDKWQAAVPFTQLLALAGLATSLEHSSGYMLLSLGRVRTLTAYYWLRLVLLVGAISLLWPEFGTLGVAMAKVLTGFLGLLVMLVLGWRALPVLGLSTVMLNVWRPVVAVILMAGVANVVSGALSFAPAPLRLSALIVAGAISYSLAILALWKLAKSPPGAEDYLLERIPGAGRLLRG